MLFHFGYYAEAKEYKAGRHSLKPQSREPRKRLLVWRGPVRSSDGRPDAADPDRFCATTILSLGVAMLRDPKGPSHSLVYVGGPTRY